MNVPEQDAAPSDVNGTTLYVRGKIVLRTEPLPDAQSYQPTTN